MYKRQIIIKYNYTTFNIINNNMVPYDYNLHFFWCLHEPPNLQKLIFYL